MNHSTSKLSPAELAARVGQAMYAVDAACKDFLQIELVSCEPGRAVMRMQVREPMLQHEVMIEAVENHNPEVIVIDEIGREAEAAAARTIAERGVQLIGTAHGQTLDNLLLNPTLSDLVGGIELTLAERD